MILIDCRVIGPPAGIGASEGGATTGVAADVGNEVAVEVGLMDELGADDSDGDDDGDTEVLGAEETEGATVGEIVVIFVTFPGVGAEVEFMPGDIVVFVSADL